MESPVAGISGKTSDHTSQGKQGIRTLKSFSSQKWHKKAVFTFIAESVKFLCAHWKYNFKDKGLQARFVKSQTNPGVIWKLKPFSVAMVVV